MRTFTSSSRNTGCPTRSSISGRARVTSRNFPAGATGLVVNVVLLLVLVPHSGAGLGIAGAGIALCGAYVAMLLLKYAFGSA